MTVATRSTGKRLDGSHWQSDKDNCVRGHDLRAEIDGQPNPNVMRHSVSGARQCLACNRLRGRLRVRLNTALRWWIEHGAACSTCPGRTCDEGRAIRRLIEDRARALTDAGFESHAASGF